MKYYSVTKTHQLPGAFRTRRPAHTVTEFFIRFEDIPENDRQIAVAHESDSVIHPLPSFYGFRHKVDHLDGTLTNTLLDNADDTEIVLA